MEKKMLKTLSAVLRRTIARKQKTPVQGERDRVKIYLTSYERPSRFTQRGGEENIRVGESESTGRATCPWDRTRREAKP